MLKNKLKRLVRSLEKRIQEDCYRYEMYLHETNSNHTVLTLFPIEETTNDDVTGMYNYVFGYCEAIDLQYEDISCKNILRFQF
mgnify:CR=1 FL=1